MVKKPKRKPSKYNLHVGREMRKGKTMKQAAASWKKGGKKSRVVKIAKKAVKSVRAKRAATKARRKTTRKTTKGVRKKMGFNTQKLMKIVRMAALVAPAAAIAMGPQSGKDKLQTIVTNYTGFHFGTGTFSFEALAKGWGPYLGAIVATYGIPKIAGIIRGL